MKYHEWLSTWPQKKDRPLSPKFTKWHQVSAVAVFTNITRLTNAEYCVSTVKRCANTVNNQESSEAASWLVYLVMTLVWYSVMTLERYFGVYFPRCCATRELNPKITLSITHKQVATRVHTLFYIFMRRTRLLEGSLLSPLIYGATLKHMGKYIMWVHRLVYMTQTKRSTKHWLYLMLYILMLYVVLRSSKTWHSGSHETQTREITIICAYV